MESVFAEISSCFVASSPFQILQTNTDLSFEKTELFDANESHSGFIGDDGDVPDGPVVQFGRMKHKEYKIKYSSTFSSTECVQHIICDLAYLLEMEVLTNKSISEPYSDSVFENAFNFDEPRVMAPANWFARYGSSNGSTKKKIPLEDERRKFFMLTMYPEYNVPLISIPSKMQTHLVVFSQSNSLATSTLELQQIDSLNFHINVGYGIQHISQCEVYCLPKIK